jgi:catechol 2,3-dioxygenase-like lactoylglutathione lyase family enzyme
LASIAELVEEQPPQRPRVARIAREQRALDRLRQVDEREHRPVQVGEVRREALAFGGCEIVRRVDHGQATLARMPDDTADDDAPGIPVTGVSELVLEVVDLEASETFYAGALGLPVVERWPAREAIWVMAGDRTRIGLWRPQVGLARGRGGIHVHFAMHLAEADYDAAVGRLAKRGLVTAEHAFPGAGRAVYADDPDGNVVELWTWDVAGHLRQRS